MATTSMSVTPTGTVRLSPRVPRASKNPRAVIEADRISRRIAVATLRIVTPTQPTSASASMSAEQASDPSPPVEGLRPARASPAQVRTVVVIPGSENVAGRGDVGARRCRVVRVALLQGRLSCPQLLDVHSDILPGRPMARWPPGVVAVRPIEGPKRCQSWQPEGSGRGRRGTIAVVEMSAVAPELRSPLLRLPSLPLGHPWGLRVGRIGLQLLRTPPVRGVSLRVPEDAPVPVRISSPRVQGDGDERRGCLVWFHGGGLVLGTARQDDYFAGLLARAAGVVVVSVDYRLAPEHPFPAALDDGLAVWRWVTENAAALGVDPARMALGGQSAGGGIAASLAQRLRDHAVGAPPAAQLLFCPMLDDRTAARVGSGSRGPLRLGQPEQPGGVAALPEAGAGSPGHAPVRGPGAAGRPDRARPAAGSASATSICSSRSAGTTRSGSPPPGSRSNCGSSRVGRTRSRSCRGAPSSPVRTVGRQPGGLRRGWPDPARAADLPRRPPVRRPAARCSRGVAG